MVLLQRKLNFSKDPEGIQHFPGGGSNFFQGVQMLISIETYLTCDFPRGWSPLSVPLDPHMLNPSLTRITTSPLCEH